MLALKSTTICLIHLKRHHEERQLPMMFFYMERVRLQSNQMDSVNKIAYTTIFHQDIRKCETFTIFSGN